MVGSALAAGLLRQISPFIKLFRVNADDILEQAGEDKVDQLLEEAVPIVAADMEELELTPALKADGAMETFIIRDAMFRVARYTIGELIPGKKDRGAGHAADFLRDQHDNQVVAQVSPLITTTTSQEDFVRIVKDHFRERMF